jgi:biofilm PGA synthesis N-glycosyltransferase PgaC
MTGARPIPVNRKDTFIGFTVHLMWALHHKIAIQTPKLGELVAFRNFVREIPKDTAVDEASIEAIMREAGYDLRYVPEAVVNNKGPETVRDFLKQRRRIAAGHKNLTRSQNYTVSTSSSLKILGVLARGAFLGIEEHGVDPGGRRSGSCGQRAGVLRSLHQEKESLCLGYCPIH